MSFRQEQRQHGGKTSIMADHSTNASVAAQAAALTIGGLFRLRARHQGQRVALENGSASYSYAELNERVNRLANALAATGVAHGERVAILSENRVEYLELQLAAAKLGAIVAAQNWRLADPELEHCIQLVEPHTMMVSPRFAERLDAVTHGAGQVVCFGAQYEALLANAACAEPPDAAQPEDGLIILYTSGTTGLPKGALISHRAMIARGQIMYLDWPGLEQGDSYVAWSPLFHMVATDMSLATLVGGGKVMVMDGYDPEALADIAVREPVGWFVLLPGTIEAFIEAMRRRDAKPAGVKVTGCMADLVPRHQIVALTEILQAPFLNTFGSTETGIPPGSGAVVGVGERPDGLPKQQNSYCQVRLLDADDNEVADGEAGELAFRGPTLFSGYWNAPDANAEEFRGGWFHLGDMFVRRPDGLLDFVDRRKYLIKSGSENIYPAEIERVLLADPRIAEAVVIRKPDDRWGEVPVALVVRKSEDLTEADVVACCEGRIARYKLPKEVRFVEDADLPRSSTGKIKRFELEGRQPGPQAGQV